MAIGFNKWAQSKVINILIKSTYIKNSFFFEVCSLTSSTQHGNDVAVSIV